MKILTFWTRRQNSLNGVLDVTTTANSQGSSSRAHARLCKFTSGSRRSSSRRPILRSLISIWPRQYQLGHGNINLVTAKSIWPRQYQFGHGKINLAPAISIYTRDFHDVILARNVLWESIQHGGE